jgi:hypothetical protein
MHNSLDELEQQIASLQTLVNQLKATGSIANIDKALIKQKCVELYENVLALPASEAQVEVVATTPSTTNYIEVDEPEALPEVLLINDVPSVEETIVPVEIPNLFAEVVKTETEIRNEQIEEIIVAEEQKVLEEQPKPMMKEEVQEISLHEKIAHAIPVKPDLSEKLASGVIGSLKAAINVNLKIAIVNDLFKENTVEYVKAIDKLNNSENIHEAMRYFTELKHTYDWDNQNTLVKELESLINKRFN